MRWLRWVTVCAVLLYSGAAFFVYWAQDALIFFPSQRQLANCDLPEGVEHWSFEGERGLLTAAENRKLVVFFHGNGGDACNWRFLGVNHLNRLGYDVLVLEYPGYGGDERPPSRSGIERGVAAADSWLAENPYDQVVAMGYSLGTGPASLFAAKGNVDRVVLFAPYDSIYKVAWSRGLVFPRFLLKTDFDNVAALHKVEAPIHIIYGNRDRVIPARFSVDLAVALEDAGGQVFRRELNGADHKRLFDSPEFDVIMAEILGE